MKITLSNSEYNFIKHNYKKYLKSIFSNDFIKELQKELELVTYINGYNLKSLNDVLEVRTGYKDLEQYLECEGI